MKIRFAILIIFLAIIFAFFATSNRPRTSSNYPNNIQTQAPTIINIPMPNNLDQNNPVSNNSNIFVAPLDRASERITKKPFGIFIIPKASPVQPERFMGYHTGTDFEIFPEELDVDVPVKVVCTGKLKIKKYASGYGGLAVEDCMLEDNPVTVIYGHLKIDSITQKVGDDLRSGDVIGILGADKSAETNGERKHLHLGFHKGSNLNILGYVQNKSELSNWIDPCLYVCQN